MYFIFYSVFELDWPAAFEKFEIGNAHGVIEIEKFLHFAIDTIIS